MTSCNALVYEAVQRIYRNAVVDRIRSGLRTAYPDDYEARVTSRFSSWDEIVRAASESARTGVVTHPHEDVFDYLDVSHFAVLLDKYFGFLAPVEGLPPEVANNIKRQVLSYVREIKTIRDPLSHPGTPDIGTFDALRAVDNTIRALRVLGMPEAAAEIEPLRKEIATKASAPESSSLAKAPSISDTLPPRDSVVVDFVGRQDILHRLWEWLAEPHAMRWLLSGDGGKGKSAIAYQFASEVAAAPSSGISGVYWLSAKERMFSEGETVRITNPQFSDRRSAVDKLLVDFGWSEHLDKPLEAKEILLIELLKQFPSLIVVDDVDSLKPEVEDAIEFLASDLPSAGVKVLLTSRRAILGMGKSSSTIEGLRDDEAQVFIDSRLRLLRIEPAWLNTRQRRRIIRMSEGSPLYIEDLLRLCTFLPVSKALDSWRDYAGDNVRRYALEREMEMLSPSARSVLEACSVTPGAVTALEIQRILGQSEDIVLEALAELRRSYLVPAPELVEGLPRFNINPNLASLVMLGLERTERLIILTTAVAAVFGGDLGRADRAIDDFRRQAEVLRKAGRLDDAEATLRAGLKQHPNSRPLLVALGSLYSRWSPRRTTDARTAWRRADELGSKDRRLYQWWSQLEGETGDWRASVDVALVGLTRLEAEDPTLLQQAGFAASRLAQGLISNFNTQRALQEFARSDELIRRAIRAGRVQGVDRYFISKSYRTWVMNADFQYRVADREDDPTARKRANGALCSRLREWLEFDPSDVIALEEAQRQASRCPDLGVANTQQRRTAASTSQT